MNAKVVYDDENNKQRIIEGEITSEDVDFINVYAANYGKTFRISKRIVRKVVVDGDDNGIRN